MYPPHEVSGPLALVDLSLWAFQVWLPLSRRGLRKALFGSLSFSLGGFCLYVHRASRLSHLFTFWTVSAGCELLPGRVRVRGTKDMTTCQNTAVRSRPEGQVTKQGCFKKLRAPLWRRCESWHLTSAALKTGFRTERSLRSAGWMERCHQVF